MAEQQNNFTMTSYDCDRTLFSQHDNNCLQHHVYQERQTFIPVHNEVPTSSIGYIDNRITANVSCIDGARIYFAIVLNAFEIICHSWPWSVTWFANHPVLTDGIKSKICFPEWAHVRRLDHIAEATVDVFERNTWSTTTQRDEARHRAQHICSGFYYKHNLLSKRPICMLNSVLSPLMNRSISHVALHLRPQLRNKSIHRIWFSAPPETPCQFRIRAKSIDFHPRPSSNQIFQVKRWVSIKILIGYANLRLWNCFFPSPATIHLTQKSILQTVPEAENERPELPQRMNNNTRFWWNSSDSENDFCTINVWILQRRFFTLTLISITEFPSVRILFHDNLWEESFKNVNSVAVHNNPVER